MKLLRILLALSLACTASKKAARNDRPSVSAPGPTPSAKWNYPQTRRENIEENIQGERIVDPYRWLEDEKSPEVKSWMEQQNQLTREFVSKIPYRQVIADRLTQLFYIESMGAPLRRGNRYFYMRTHPNKEKAILYWREGENGQEKVLLDPNTWSESGVVSLGNWNPSWDGTRVAFKQRPYANDESVLHVIDVKTGRWSEVDVIEGTKYGSLSWAPDNKSLYYTWIPSDASIPASDRPGYQEVRLHRLGTAPSQDEVIVPKSGDPTLFVGASITRDGKYLFLRRTRIAAEDEISMKRARLDREFKVIARGKNTRYSINYWKDELYIVTDEDAPNKRVFKAPALHPERKNWEEIIPEDRATLEQLNIVGGQLALQYLKNASSELRIARLDGRAIRTVPLPGIGSASELSGMEDQDDAYFSFSSPMLPPQIYKTSLKTGDVRLWAKIEMPSSPHVLSLSRFGIRPRTALRCRCSSCTREICAKTGKIRSS